ncbi:MAG: transposase, partial [Bacteroidota bacterium]
EIFAYVIMPNHLHMVVRDTKPSLSSVLRDFKTFTSKKLFEMITQNPQESRKEWMLHLFRKAGRNNPLNL